MLWLWLACAPKAPVAPPPVEPVLAPALPEAALSPALDLTGQLKAHIALQQAAITRAPTDETALCDAVTESEALSEGLALHISERAWASGGYDATVEEATHDLSDALPGVLLGWGAEGLYASAEWPLLIDTAGSEASPAGALLEAHYALVGDFHHVNWLDWSWDLGGCTNLETTASALTAVADAWEPAPACLQDALRPRLKAEVTRMSAHRCYCVSAEEVAHQLDALVPVLERLPQLEGPAAAEALRSGLSDGSAVYEDPVCGG